MIDLSFWNLIAPGFIFLALLAVLIVKGFGVIKLELTNRNRIRELRQMAVGSESSANKDSLNAIANQCTKLNSKWILKESDLDIAGNTYRLLRVIAALYHPESRTPVEEARIRKVLQACLELKNRLLGISKWRGVHKLTQFRLRHILFLSEAWRIKEQWKEWALVKFLMRHNLYGLFQWFFFLIRCADLTFWSMKMLIYIIHDLVFKVFLVHWYLVIGELATKVYQDSKEKSDEESEIEAKNLMEDFESIPESDPLGKSDLPDKIQNISNASRKELLFHVGSLNWEQTRANYIRLVEEIALSHYPQSDQPLYETTLFDLLMSGVRFLETLAAIQNYPFVHRLLDLRVTHILLVKDTANFLKDNQFLSWVKKRKMNYVFKYSYLLFQVVRKANPGLLFKDFAVTLAGEGFKRWFFLHLHEKIVVEAHMVYQDSSPERQ
jgi:hypothetical protein